MIYIAPMRLSTGTLYLVRWLNENGHEAFRAKNETTTARMLRNVRRGDLVVGWGTTLPEFPAGVKLLNKKHIGSKFQELECLARANVQVPEYSLRPQGRGWYARTYHHQCANDLLANLNRGDYYVKHVDAVHELRFHVMKGEVFRVGYKVKDGPDAHPIFKSEEAGWHMVYGRESAGNLWQLRGREDLRQAALASVKACKYDFGAVDLATTKDGGYVVWEVNSAPGIDHVTVRRYGEQLIRIAQGE